LKLKKSVHILLLFFISAFILLFQCDCDPVGPDFEIWLISPENEAIIQTPRVTLEWDWSAVNSNFDHGYLLIRTNSASGYTEIAISESDRTYDIDTLRPATTYYWIVSICDEWRDGCVDSPRWFFTTAAELWEPGHVHSPTPDSGAVGVSVNPNFTWDVYNPDLLGYDFDIYLGTTTDPPLLDSELAGPYYNLLTDTLDYATLYYWRVEAYYDNDTSRGPLWEFMTDYSVEADIFAMIEIDALQSSTGYHVMEEIRALFDSAIAPVTPIKPLQADSVFVGDAKLDWNAGSQNYSYSEMSMPFINNGGQVDIDVYGNSEVPNLNTDINFPACTLAIISPETFNTVSISGFEVTWDGSECGGNVWLTLMDGNDSIGVWKETNNDGIDSLTAADLAPLGGQTGTYSLIIIKQVEENIDAPGYRPESLIRMRAFNLMAQINIASK
jgi:hypothetical protein